MHVGFWWEILNERDHYENLDVGGKIILRWFLRDIEWDGKDWIDLTQDRDQWKALVNTVMNLLVL
jgi:hypothetical protein